MGEMAMKNCLLSSLGSHRMHMRTGTWDGTMGRCKSLTLKEKVADSIVKWQKQKIYSSFQFLSGWRKDTYVWWKGSKLKNEQHWEHKCSYCHDEDLDFLLMPWDRNWHGACWLLPSFLTSLLPSFFPSFLPSVKFSSVSPISHVFSGQRTCWNIWVNKIYSNSVVHIPGYLDVSTSHQNLCKYTLTWSDFLKLSLYL